jgi:hypothetical protein
MSQHSADAQSDFFGSLSDCSQYAPTDGNRVQQQQQQRPDVKTRPPEASTEQHWHSLSRLSLLKHRRQQKLTE